MNTKKEILFWIVTIILLTLLFSVSFNGIILAFYFVMMLFPVVLGTSVFFNKYLVPKYLLKGLKLKFGIYFVYMLIVSIYLELLVMILALVILANYNVKNLGTIASNTYFLTIAMYLIVFLDGFVGMLRKLRDQNRQLDLLEEANKKYERHSIVLRVNRKNVPIDVSEIIVIESFKDYVKVHTMNEQYITKEKISHLEASLPDNFLRIHRSYLINQSHIQSFNRENVTVMDQSYPISRTYKRKCLETLNESTG